MARNPFEQLRDVVSEPRQAFEDIVALILKCLYPESRRVRVYHGDGGIDAFSGTLGEDGNVDVFQIKYFPDPWQDSQKQQIRDAYKSARECQDYQLGTWTLCVPARLRKEDLRWFDEWRKKQDRVIELRDGDDLTLDLQDSGCAIAREKLRQWGLVGVGRQTDFSVLALVHQQDPRRGLTASIVLFFRNTGDKSAHDIGAKVTHSETNCLAGPEQIGWERSGGRLNPRTLRYNKPLNPTEGIAIMEIYLCERSVMPVSISVRLTAQDMPASSLQCELNSEQIAAGKPVRFLPSSG